MIWAKYDPAAKTVTYVDNSSTADETDNIRERCPECQDENLKIAIEHQASITKTKHKNKVSLFKIFCNLVQIK